MQVLAHRATSVFTPAKRGFTTRQSSTETPIQSVKQNSGVTANTDQQNANQQQEMCVQGTSNHGRQRDGFLIPLLRSFCTWAC
jgi:hypothetical protein